MARYFFHLSNGHTTLDDVGSEHADLGSVRKEAFGASREMLMLGHEGTEDFWAGEPWRLWGTDRPNAAGRTILTVELCAREGGLGPNGIYCDPKDPNQERTAAERLPWQPGRRVCRKDSDELGTVGGADGSIKVKGMAETRASSATTQPTFVWKSR